MELWSRLTVKPTRHRVSGATCPLARTNEKGKVAVSSLGRRPTQHQALGNEFGCASWQSTLRIRTAGQNISISVGCPFCTDLTISHNRPQFVSHEP